MPIKTVFKTHSKVKKVNFMVRIDTLERLLALVPEGERSKFVNGAVEEALSDFSRKKASELIDKAREELHWRMTPEEIRKAIKYGRE